MQNQSCMTIPRRTDPDWKMKLASTFSSVPVELMHTERQGAGLYFGQKRILGTKYHIGNPGDGNTLTIGGSGCGKSSCEAMPSLESWRDPLVAIDVKGELSSRYRDLFECGRVSRHYIRFAPMEDDGWRYDPFDLLRQADNNHVVQYAREIALSILPLPQDVREPFWIEAAQNLLTGELLYHYSVGSSFSKAMTDIQLTPVEQLMDVIAQSDNAYAKMFIHNLRDTKPEVLAGIATELSNGVMVFATDPYINRVFEEASEENRHFSWNHIETHNIFLSIPEHKIAQWRGVITLMTNQLFRYLERRPEKHSPQGAFVRPLLLLLDEFPRLGKVDIVSAISTLRSKKVTIAIFIQSLAQLEMIYGEHASRVIADNCAYKVFLGANDPQSQRYMSELIGDHEVAKASHTTNYAPHTPQTRENETGQSITVSKHYEPIIRPAEFGRLKDVVLVTSRGYSRVKKAPYYLENQLGFWGRVKEIARNTVDRVKQFFQNLF